MMKTKIITAALLLPVLVIFGAPSSSNTNLNEREQQIITAAHTGAAPQFHGAAIIGIQPGTPFLHAVAVTGDRPMTFSARHLPRGLKLDAQTGILTGSLPRPLALPANAKGDYLLTHSSAPSNYTVILRAKNATGTAATELTIIAGDTLALTPPLGWNSYDNFGDAVTETETLANAAWMQAHLQPLGWDLIVVDFRWYDSKADGQRVQNPEGVQLDAFGRCVPAPNRFPSATNGAGFKPLADQLHARGLKFGIHIMRGIPRQAVAQNLPIAGSKFTAAQAVVPESDTNRTCVWNHDMFGVDATTDAGKAWYASIAQQYADWGVDYIKCDDIADMFRGKYYSADEIAALSTGLKNSGRSIILSLSPGPTPVNASEHLKKFANLWRVSNDFWDNWKSLDHNFSLFAEWQGNGAPGHWPDGDMIPFGRICQRNCDVRPDRWTRFTRDEQLTLMSLWALAPSPLMLGMNLPDNDAWTTAILTSPEVLAVDQDALGKPARRMTGDGDPGEMWVKTLADGAYAVGFFNRTNQPVNVNYAWQRLGFTNAPTVRDLWLRQDLERSDKFTASLPPHGCVLLRVK